MSLATRLKRHWFAVDAHFDRVVALSFAFPEEVVRPVVPSALTLDTHNGFAFVTVAMVWTRAFRPTGFPAILGQSFFLAGYRVFTKFQEPIGRRLRGLNILRSYTDQRRMVHLGNLLTAYHYQHVKVRERRSGDAYAVDIHNRRGERTLDIAFTMPDGEVALPSGSPFATWSEARRFAGPRPFTCSAENASNIVVIEGSRQHWEPRPIAVSSWTVSLFDEAPFRSVTPVLANAFAVEGVDYHWKRGRVVAVAQSQLLDR